MQEGGEGMKKVPVSYLNRQDTAEDPIDPSLVEPMDDAEPTNIAPPAGFAAEWKEPAIMPDGRKCLRMYLFTAGDIVDKRGKPLAAEDYPWDDEHVVRIILDS